MAMSREEQSAAARRIMEKEPMTAEERVVYEQLVKSPEEYLPPDPEKGIRTCGVCGMEFREQPGLSALQQHSDHMTGQNPPVGTWGEAYHRIRSAKGTDKD